MMLLGVFGDQRVRHSLSPAMHNAVLAQQGLKGCYLPFAVEPARLPQATEGIRALGLAGVNVTVPHKQAVVPCLDALKGEAERLGAVNTIVNQEGVLVGHNTDVAGFGNALAQAGFQAAGRRALVLGAGGAARAVVLALTRAGAARVWVAGRTLPKVQALADDLQAAAAELKQGAELVAEVHLLVNATSVSSAAESASLAALAAGLTTGGACSLVVDLNYGRPDNLWQGWARRQGARFMDGLAMLAHQARLSFELWTGIKPPLAQFLAGLDKAA